MRWISIFPLLFLACTTDSPETKKASLNMREACGKQNILKMDKPETWQAYIEGSHSTVPVSVEWHDSGFVIPCENMTGDSIQTLVIYYQ